MGAFKGWQSTKKNRLFAKFPTIGFVEQNPFYIASAYGAPVCAYSLRVVDQNFTSCIRVRRSSDNTETNIGFAGNVLDVSALLAFTGAGNGFVSQWFDQSANASHLYQGDTTKQPRIVLAGVVDRSNGLPSILFDGINDTLNGPVTSFDIVQGMYSVTAAKTVNAGRNEILLNTNSPFGNNAIQVIPRWSDNITYQQIGYINQSSALSSLPGLNLCNYTARGGLTQQSFFNGAPSIVSANQSQAPLIGTVISVGSWEATGNLLYYLAGYMSEVLILPTVPPQILTIIGNTRLFYSI